MTLDFSAHPIAFADARDSFKALRALGVRAIDGDTIVAVVDLGFGTYMSMRLRITGTVGINTPELVGTTGAEHERALNAKDTTEALVAGKPLLVRTFATKSGEPKMTFQRYVAVVIAVDVMPGGGRGFTDVARTLVMRGLADEVTP